MVVTCSLVVVPSVVGTDSFSWAKEGIIEMRGLSVGSEWIDPLNRVQQRLPACQSMKVRFEDKG